MEEQKITETFVVEKIKEFLIILNVESLNVTRRIYI